MPPPSPHEDSVSPGRPPVILVVDDEEILRQAIAWDFQRKGFKVLEAENGRVALDLVEREKVDIVLTDVRMPVCDGVELLNQLRARDLDAPVVLFLTGYADLTPENAYDLGAEAVFSKPFDRKQLFATVMNALVAREKRWEQEPGDAGDAVVECSIAGELPGGRGEPVHLGRGGAFISRDSGALPASNELVTFRFQAGAGSLRMIEGTGVVRWVRTTPASDADGRAPRGFGIEFQRIERTQRAELLRLLHRKKPRAWIPKA